MVTAPVNRQRRSRAVAMTKGRSKELMIHEQKQYPDEFTQHATLASYCTAATHDGECSEPYFLGMTKQARPNG